MDPSRHVLLALTGGAVVFLVAGGNITALSAKVQGKPTDAQVGGFMVGTIAGWAGLLLILGFASDIPPVAPLAVGFAWLIFLSIMLMFGEKAAANAASLLGLQNKPTPAPMTYTGKPIPVS